MSDSISDAFYAGIYDGVAEGESQTKVASAFFDGLRDGVEDATREPILNKIASLVGDDEEVVEEEGDLSLSDIIRQRISGDA